MAARATSGAAKKRATAATAAPATPAKRTRNAEATRERILQVCMEVFSQSGFRGMRIAEIAKQVGITEAGVLHHYPSKQALLDALLEYRERESIAVQQEIRGLRGFAGLRALARYGELITDNPVRVQLLLVLQAENLGPEQYSGDFFRTRNGSTRDAIAARIREAQDAGEARPDIDVEAHAREAQAFMDGIGLAWLTDLRGFDLAEAWRLYIEGLIARISVPQRRRR